MTALPEGSPPTTEAETEPHMAAQPDRGEADDGKAGGSASGGKLAPATHRGDGAGVNAQSGDASGSEHERDAPGMSTDKKADDTK